MLHPSLLKVCYLRFDLSRDQKQDDGFAAAEYAEPFVPKLQMPAGGTIVSPELQIVGITEIANVTAELQIRWCC